MATETVDTGNQIRSARLAESLTVAWMVVELVVALVAGILARSVALVAFGIDSAIELFTAGVVLRMFILHTERTDSEELDRRERQASRLVGWSLYAVIAYIVASAAFSLASGSHPESSVGGMALAAAALVIMPLLWRWRLGLAARLRSPAALRADAACSLVCIYMSATLLAGLLLNRLAGWWWADPVAALAMIWWIQGEAAEALEAARSGRREGDD